MSKEEKELYVCGACGNKIQNLDSLQLHLIFTSGCNILTKNKFPVCACGKTFDSRSGWNQHSCPGKRATVTALFNRMTAADKNCYRTEVGCVSRPRAGSVNKTPTKRTPTKKVEKKKGSKKEKKNKEKEKKRKEKEKKKKEKEKKKGDDSDEESTISLNETSETLSDSHSSSSNDSSSESSSSEEQSGKKRKLSLPESQDNNKKKKIFISTEHLRQWELMVDYSKNFEHGNPLHTLGQQSMAELEIFEKPGCIAFLKKYLQSINPIVGFGRREILKFVQGDSRMFICRSPEEPDGIKNVIEIIQEQNPRVIKLWEEDMELKHNILSLTPYFWVDTIVAPSGNLVGVYTSDNSLPTTPESEQICVMCLPFNVVVPQEFIDLVVKYEESMVPHYSPANADKTSWKGIALKGYTPSHKDLHKPEEMSKEWQKNHSISGTQSYEADLQKTDLMINFKYYLSQLKKAIPGKMHRIRILSLLPGGKITRHSDKPIQSDLDKGKYLRRYHLPLTTNENVKMKIWNLHGELIEIKMEVGNVYYFDNRKPHAVSNDGETTRHHLVFDIEYDILLDPITERSFKITSGLDLENFSEKFNAWKESTELSKIEFVENEEEKAQGEAKRIEKEKKQEEEKERKRQEDEEKERKRKEEEEEKERKRKEEAETMVIDDKAHSSSQKLFPGANDSDDAFEDSQGSKKRSLRSNTTRSRSSSVSISDKFESAEEEEKDSESDQEEKDVSNYKLGKKGSKSPTTSTSKESKKRASREKQRKSTPSKVQEYVTIDSQEEEEDPIKGADGYSAKSLEDFLNHYGLSHLEEAFRKNKLEDKLDQFFLMDRSDLKELGFVMGDILLWKKFNPSV